MAGGREKGVSYNKSADKLAPAVARFQAYEEGFTGFEGIMKAVGAIQEAVSGQFMLCNASA